MELNNQNFSDKAKRDLNLIRRANMGDTRAFTEILDYYEEPIYFMLHKMVGNKEDAEDLTLEAFEKAFRNLNSYTPSFAFSTWLFKIATNCGIDFIRTQKIRSKYINIRSAGMTSEINDMLLTGAEETGPNPEQYAIEQQQNHQIFELIKRMPPDYRRILSMRFFEEFSYSEIAEKLQIPIGTVKTRIFRARNLLESMLNRIK